MDFPADIAIRIAVALGIGLLIGVDRERHKGETSERVPAGIRTFALVSLIGALSWRFGGMVVFAVAAVFIGAAVVVSYIRSSKNEIGLTTEMALVVTFLLGAMAMQEPGLASALGVTVAILLAARGWLHKFSRVVLTTEEFQDALMLLGAALVILPLVPNQTIGPFGVLNPQVLWRLTVLVMAVSAAGHVAVRLLGPRYGLPLAGLASGFVSSAATIGAMGSKAQTEPELHGSAAAGAVLSSVATVVQMYIVVGATNTEVLRAIAIPMGMAGLVAILYGLVFMLRSTSKKPETEHYSAGRPFDPRIAIVFAVTVGLVIFVAAAVTQWLGSAALTVAIAFAGFADAHAPSISSAAMVSAGQISADAAVLPILAAFTTNSVTKLMVARMAGDGKFLAQIAPGLILMTAAAWLTWLLA